MYFLLTNILFNDIITIYIKFMLYKEKRLQPMKRFTKILSFIFALTMILCCFPAEIISSAAQYNWVGAWGTPAVESGVVLGDSLHLQDYIPAGSTIRSVIVPTISGTKIKLKFSNLYGSQPITINEVTVAQTGATDDLIDPKTVTQVTFNGGQKSVTIAAGSEISSDEITFSVTALKKISVSSYYKKTTTMYTTGLYNATTYLASSLGNRTHKESMTSVATRFSFTSGTITYTPVPFLTRLDVYAQDAYSVVILGDSTVTNEISLMLAEKLQKNGVKNVGVVMSGIIGNELLNKGSGLLGKIYGESLLKRAKRDAFDIPGVKYVIVKIGINDVLHPMLESNKGKMPLTTAAQVTAGYRELAQQAYRKGINLYLCTRTPYKGYERAFMGSKDLNWTQQGENTLLEINSWVKNSAKQYNYAGYIDLDAVRDPADPAKLRTHMTEDGAHLTKYGQIAVTDLIPEAAYGVNKELKDYADIINIDPYVAPAVPEPTTKAPANNNNNNTNNNSNNTPTTNNAGNNNTVKPTEAPTNINPGVVVTPQTTTMPGANQIVVDTPLGGDQTVSGNVSNFGTDTARKIIGFAVLAAVGMAIITVAAIMIVKIRPESSDSPARGGNGRANQKKKV